MLSKKENKSGDMDGDDDEFPISPRTDENYRKIDAAFARAMNDGGGVKVMEFHCFGNFFSHFLE